MKPTARSVAFDCLLAVTRDDAYANLLLPKLLGKARLEQRDAAMAQELAFGTLRMQGRYDRIIEQAANRKVADISREALILLRLGTHQLLAMRVSAHAAINETVQLAKSVASQGAAGFINGCLRRVSERTDEEWSEVLAKGATDELDLLAIEHSHPLWIVRAFQKALQADDRSDDLTELLVTDNQAPRVNVVALPGFASEHDVENLISSESSPIGYVLESGDPAALESVKAGRLRVQDAGSQIAALALTRAFEPTAGEVWLDMCAGPGGKAALMAAEAQLADARLVAAELQPPRTELVRSALETSGFDDVEVVTKDGRDWAKQSPDTFDRILLDAPCSGLGALRRRPEARWRKQPKDIGDLSQLQQELFLSAFAALKPGGVLAYVTCSPHVGETTSVIEWAQRKLGDEMRQLDTPAVLAEVNPKLELNRNRKSVQLWSQVHNTDDMFIALVSKSLG